MANVINRYIYIFSFHCRDLSLEVLKREPEGSFIVRASNSKNGLALSVRVPQDFHPEGIVHYLIIRSPKGFKIKVCKNNSSDNFPNLVNTDPK